MEKNTKEPSKLISFKNKKNGENRTDSKKNFNTKESEKLNSKFSKFKSKKKKYVVKNPLVIPEEKYPIEYKRLGLLRHFLTKYGKIRPRRVSKISLKQQRKIGKAIRRARGVGLIPCSIIAKNRKNNYATISKK